MRRVLRDNALSLTMFGLFFVFLLAQSIAGHRAANSENEHHGQPPECVTSGTFDEATFENWKSQFLAVGTLAVLGILLRQRGSPESKPVAAPHAETGTS